MSFVQTSEVPLCILIHIYMYYYCCYCYCYYNYYTLRYKSCTTSFSFLAVTFFSSSSITNFRSFNDVAHTLQLCINSALDVPALQRVLSACRKLVGHFKHSVLGMAALKDKQTQLGIPVHHLMQDVATRWNSTYFMIERLCEQRVAIYAV